MRFTNDAKATALRWIVDCSACYLSRVLERPACVCETPKWHDGAEAHPILTRCAGASEGEMCSLRGRSGAAVPVSALAWVAASAKWRWRYRPAHCPAPA